MVSPAGCVTQCSFASLTPNQDPQAAPVAPIPPKKNRLEGDVLTRSETKDSDLVADNAPRDDGTHSDEDSNTSAKGDGEPAAENKKEGQTVKEVRRKVEEMNWKEGERPDTTPSGDHEDSEQGDKSVEESKDDDWVQVDKSEVKDEDDSTLKRKAEADAEGDKKRHSTSVSQRINFATERTSSNIQPAPPEPATTVPSKPKPQATFGAFSSKASPFAAASSSSSSPFGAAAASSSPFGAIAKGNALDSGTSTTNALDSATAKKTSAFASSGFGSFASTSSPFAKKPSSAEEKKDESSSFGDILKEKGDAVEEKKIQLDKQESECIASERRLPSAND